MRGSEKCGFMVPLVLLSFVQLRSLISIEKKKIILLRGIKSYRCMLYASNGKVFTRSSMFPLSLQVHGKIPLPSLRAFGRRWEEKQPKSTVNS